MMRGNTKLTGAVRRPEASQTGHSGGSLILRLLAADLAADPARLSAFLYRGVMEMQTLSDDPQTITWQEVGTTTARKTITLTAGSPSMTVEIQPAFLGYFIDEIQLGISGTGNIGDDAVARLNINGLKKATMESIVGGREDLRINTVVQAGLTFDFSAIVGGTDTVVIEMAATGYLPDEAFRQRARATALEQGADIEGPYRDLMGAIQSGAMPAVRALGQQVASKLGQVGQVVEGLRGKSPFSTGGSRGSSGGGGQASTGQRTPHPLAQRADLSGLGVGGPVTGDGGFFASLANSGSLRR